MVVPVSNWYPRLCAAVALAMFWAAATLVQADESLQPEKSPQPEESHPLVVRYPEMSSRLDQRNSYYEDLLRLALDKSREAFGDYRLKPVPLRVPQGRILRLLSAGEEVDVLWTMTTRNREQHLRPVRIPLAKGMAGYRLLVVRERDSDRFAAVQSLEDLADRLAGQATDWPDTVILRHNNLPVTTNGYFSLFTMLQRERIDYIPRALNEPWVEVAQRPELDLQVEPTLMLYYPTASYFFVRKQNAVLAKRLEQGLEVAIADGSFDELFLRHPRHRPIFEQAHLSRRRVLMLDNPLLPERTPLDRPELWWQPDEMVATEADECGAAR